METLRKGGNMKNLQPRLFKRRLATNLVPLLISIAVLGTFAIIVTMNFVKSNIDNSNRKLLNQAIERIAALNEDIDTVNINFAINPDVTIDLKQIMNSQSFDLQEVDQVKLLESFLSAPAYSKPDIQSIYVYFNNSLRRFISTNDGLTTLDKVIDTGWYDSYLKNNGSSQVWYEVRHVKMYNFESKQTTLLTVYKNIYQSGLSKATGVIVLNIQMDYIVNLLKNMCSYTGQRFLLLDNNGQLICESGAVSFHANDFQGLPRDSGNVIRQINSQLCSVSETTSEKYNMRIVSVIPVKELYEVPIRLLETTFLLLVLTLVVGVVMAYRLAKNNFNHIQTINSIIDSAESGTPVQPLSIQTNDEYSYIINNIIKTFIEQDYLKMQLSERMYKEKAMELLALQSQINPHFMFNTLETIYLKALALTGTHNEVNTMIENLSTILKYSQSKSDETITIQDEVENAKSYVDLQKIRYRDKFHVIWDFKDDLRQYTIIKFVLQPLIENAISYSAKDKPILIKVKIRVNPETVTVKVTDNGIGISNEKLMQLKTIMLQDINNSQHIGLYNTNKRIKLCYGDAYGLEIKSKFGFGTSVHITIPKIASGATPKA
jgi:two-component system sensor histidine kinase YesM